VAQRAALRQKRDERVARARLAVVDYLSCFPPQTRPLIVLGGSASVYGQEKVVVDIACTGRSDVAVWLDGSIDEELRPWLLDISPAL
jgi:hypothetical protein